jgi:signal transduction histidine kinase
MSLKEIPRRASSGWLGSITGPLGRRLLAGLLVLSLFPLVLSNALGYLRSTAIIEGLVERYLAGIADIQSRHVGAQLERHLVFLNEAAVRSEMVEAVQTWQSTGRREADVNAFLDKEMSAHPGFEALYVFTASGTLIASAPLPPADLEFWIGPPLEQPIAPVDVVRDAEPPHEPRLRLAVPVAGDRPGSTGVFLGGWVQVLGPAGFLQLPEHTAGSVESFVVGDSGVPIYISHPHGFVDYAVPLASPLVNQQVGSSEVYVDRQSVEVIGTMVAVPGQPWRLITEVPISNALQELRQLRGVSVWLGSLLALIVIVLALAMAGRIVAPVRRLVAATRRLAGGALDARVQVRDRDEIGELGAAFNDMASELAQTSARVQELHQREIERAGQLATVGELASGVAHEIKNPIQGISGGLDLVTRHTKADEKLSPIVDEMRRQVSRVSMAVRDLLAFARPIPPAVTPTDLNEVVERALTLVRPMAEKADVSITVDAGRLPTVSADEEMIRQSLVNILVNGVQATEGGGQVAIATQAVDGRVEVRISDTGSGIPPDQLEQIFKPFYTTKHQGTGLGLSITRGIIQRHGGKLSVTSEADAGTTFTITLSAAEDEQQSVDGDSDTRG